MSAIGALESFVGYPKPPQVRVLRFGSPLSRDEVDRPDHQGSGVADNMVAAKEARPPHRDGCRAVAVPKFRLIVSLNQPVTQPVKRTRSTKIM